RAVHRGLRERARVRGRAPQPARPPNADRTHCSPVAGIPGQGVAVRGAVRRVRLDLVDPTAEGEPMSDDLLARHRAVMPNWMALYYEEPIEITGGSGRHVTDAGGNEYLDFFAGILTNAVGYDIPEISDAVRAQVDTGVLHTSTLYLIRQQVELA